MGEIHKQAGRGPVAMAEIVKRVFVENRFEQRTREEALALAWREHFGSEYGEFLRREGDSLVVRVTDPARRYELEFAKARILAELAGSEPFRAVKRLRFVG